MNKPYFTKYIPVEGEIKRGDKYFHSNGLVQQLSQDVHLSLLSEINKRGKLAKLFLCSRDIQVGDTVFNKYYGGYDVGKKMLTNSDVMDAGMLSGGEPDDDNDHWSGNDKAKWQWEYDHQTYKVIGEVSHNAVWVKEGMEFELDNITIGSSFVKFKCPTCNTFH